MTDTASTRDLNMAFAAERAGQLDTAQQQRSDVDRRLADGTLIKLGDGRYRVNDPGSWDHGEVLYLQDGQIPPQHGPAHRLPARQEPSRPRHRRPRRHRR